MIAAGPAVNFVIAFLILAGYFAARGVPDADLAVDRVDRRAAAGVLQPGDRIVSVDGKPGDEPGSRKQIASPRALRNRPPEVDGCQAATPADGRRRSRRRAPHPPIRARSTRPQTDAMLIGFTTRPANRDVGRRRGVDAP